MTPPPFWTMFKKTALLVADGFPKWRAPPKTRRRKKLLDLVYMHPGGGHTAIMCHLKQHPIVTHWLFPNSIDLTDVSLVNNDTVWRLILIYITNLSYLSYPTYFTYHAYYIYLAYLTNLPYLACLIYLVCRTYLNCWVPQQQNLFPFIVYWPVILEGSKPPQLNGVKNPGALNAACLLLNWQQLRQAASRPSPQPRQRCQPDEKWFEKIFNTRER